MCSDRRYTGVCVASREDPGSPKETDSSRRGPPGGGPYPNVRTDPSFTKVCHRRGRGPISSVTRSLEGSPVVDHYRCHYWGSSWRCVRQESCEWDFDCETVYVLLSDLLSSRPPRPESIHRSGVQIAFKYLSARFYFI